MSRSESIKLSLDTILKQKKLPFLISSFDRTQLKNNIILKPLVKQFTTNRYKVFLESIRSFLASEVVEINEIIHFSTKLFKVISNDIIVLQDNEQIREQSVISEKKLQQLDKELSTLKGQLIANTEEIRTFDEMLEFTGGVLAAYNKRLNQCKDIYETMYKVEISTTLEIETVYDPNVSQQFYEKYHSQLTNVLGRMKRTLESLVQQIKVASNVDMPLRCHNFLVNSRNLILELESFLIDKNCVFNRLLSYVITLHQKNLNELLEKGTDKVKINSVVYEVIEKNFYMFKMIDGEIAKIQQSFQTCKREIEAKFRAKNYNEVSKLAKHCSKQTILYYQSIKDIRAFISNIDEEYMKYLTRSQFNVKMKKMNDLKGKVKVFQKYVMAIAQLGENDMILKQKEVDLRQQGEKLARMVGNYVNKLDPFTEDIFKKVYTEIQNKFIQICSIQQTLKTLNNDHTSELKTTYIEQKLLLFSHLQESYFRTQKSLISLIQQYKQGYQEQSQKNINNADDTISKCRLCLQKLDPTIEANIEQWRKSEINRETRFLQLIMHAEGQIYKERQSHQQKGLFEDTESINKKKETLAELARMKLNFEALMRCYDTLVYKNSLSSLISELSFETKQQLKKQIEQNKQSLEEINSYYKQLKQNEKPEIKSELTQKVQQITKERLTVMQQVLTTYSCIFQVYAKMKSKPEPEELRSRYVQVGNQKILDYLTLIYLSRKELMNRIKEINSSTKLHKRTKEFLEVILSDILSPLEIKTTMEELQKYIICLGKTMEFGVKTQELITDMIKKIGNPKDELWRGRVVGIAEEIMEWKRSIDVLDTLEDGPLGKMSFGNLKNQVKKIGDYFVLAEEIVKEKMVERMMLEVEVKDQKVKELRNRVVQVLGGGS